MYVWPLDSKYLLLLVSSYTWTVHHFSFVRQPFEYLVCIHNSRKRTAACFQNGSCASEGAIVMCRFQGGEFGDSRGPGERDAQGRCHITLSASLSLRAGSRGGGRFAFVSSPSPLLRSRLPHWPRPLSPEKKHSVIMACVEILSGSHGCSSGRFEDFSPSLLLRGTPACSTL